MIVRLIEIGTVENEAEEIAEQFGIEKKSAAELVRFAWEKIRLAGICDKQVELGLAKKQNERIYHLAIENGNLYAAQSARNELSKLLRLYEVANLSAIDEALQTETERLTREHLENLKVAEAGLPLEELARRVALYVVNHINDEGQLDGQLPAKERRKRASKPRTVATGSRHRADSADSRHEAEGKGEERPPLLPDDVPTE